MSERLRGLGRILKVQGQLKRMADWRCAEAERACADVEAARGELAAFLDANLLTGGLAAAAASRWRRLDERAVAAAAALDAEREARRHAAAREKLMAGALDGLAREEAAARERKELERLAEASAARAGPVGDP